MLTRAREAGLRRTKALENVLSILVHSHQPLSLADIAESPDLTSGADKATVYRVLVKLEELALIRRLAQWPRGITAAAQAREPHRIAFFLYDVAADFHMLWNRGKDDSTLQFLQADHRGDSLARLALVAATAVVIRSGLGVMGVAPVEEMR